MFPCEIKVLPVQPTLAIRFRAAVQDLPQHFQRVYGEIMEYLSEVGGDTGDFAYAKYFNLDMQNLDVEAGFPVDKLLAGRESIYPSEIAAGTYAICHYKGPYGESRVGYDELMQYTKEHGFTPSGPFYEWYLNGPDVPPQDLKTDLVIAVKRMTERVAL